jgi:Putative zinc-finger
MANDGNRGVHSTFEQLVTPYCFGEATEKERLSFEIHLFECDQCWEEVQRLEAAVHNLRTDRKLLERFITPASIGFFGLSGRLRQTFGGHGWHVGLASALYALIYAISLVFEVVYAFDRFGRTAWWVAGLGVLPWILVTSLLALWLDWKITSRNKNWGLYAAMGVCAGAAMLLLAASSFYLPNVPVVQSGARAYPAAIAYMKDALYYLPYALVYLVVPFHFILSVQGEILNGRYRMSFALLTGDRRAIGPRNAVFPPVWLLGAILAAVGMLSVYLTTNLFDHLERGPYTTIFMFLIQLRTFAYFALGMECLIWYSRSLDDLKRECLVVMKDFGRDVP